MFPSHWKTAQWEILCHMSLLSQLQMNISTQTCKLDSIICWVSDPAAIWLQRVPLLNLMGLETLRSSVCSSTRLPHWLSGQPEFEIKQQQKLVGVWDFFHVIAPRKMLSKSELRSEPPSLNGIYIWPVLHSLDIMFSWPARRLGNTFKSKFVNWTPTIVFPLCSSEREREREGVREGRSAVC